MGRIKLTIEKIKDDRKRRTTFKKRKDGLLKKAKELSILCDAEIAVFMFTKTSNQQVCLHEYGSKDCTSTLARISQFEGPVVSRNNENFDEKVDPQLQFIAAHQPNYQRQEAAQFASGASMQRHPAFSVPSRQYGQNYLPMTEFQYEQMRMLQEERRRVNHLYALAAQNQNLQTDRIEDDGDEHESSDDETIGNIANGKAFDTLDNSFATETISTTSTNTNPFDTSYHEPLSSCLGLDATSMNFGPAPVEPLSAPPVMKSSVPSYRTKTQSSRTDRRSESMKNLNITIPSVMFPPLMTPSLSVSRAERKQASRRNPNSNFPGPLLSPRFDVPNIGEDTLQTGKFFECPTAELPFLSSQPESLI